MPHAALFDMDKTLIRVNSARLFTRFRRDRGEVGLRDSARVSWWLLRYWFGNLDAPSVARKVLEEYKNTKESELIALCDDWFAHYVKRHITQIARQRVEEHRRRGDHLIIASSATQFVTRPLLRELNMDGIVCSMLELENGVLTGRVVDPICYGPGKRELALEHLEQLDIPPSQATFYSDSITDLPLLEAVGTPVAVNPDLRLLLIAKKRGWPIEYW